MATPDARISFADLDALDAERLGRRLNEKWNTYPDKDVLCAWVAEMDFPLARPIRAVLERALETDDVGYAIALRDTGLADAFAARMDERFGWRVEPERCEILSEVVQGLYLSLLAYSEPGDGAVVQTPIYPPFLSAVRETGRALVENRLVRTGGPGDARFEIDFDALARDAGARTRVLLLCNPHNPTGRVFGRAELERLAALALERDWVVVTDEIHADLVFDGRRHVPFATLSPEVAARTVTLTSASKAFNIPGLRTAVAHFGSRELQQRFDGAVPRHVRGGIGILGIYATIAAWRDSQPWLDTVRDYLAANRDTALAYLGARCPEVVTTPLEATYLLWLDCSALGLAPSPARFLYEHGRIALSDGRAFGRGFEGFARLNLATSRAILEEILERFATAVERR
ncbi:MAG: PatB family C-S lyase [Myxococcales bacterium]|nr:PatB family C-S lyase [Myxococcales bacterium]